ncbi:hypothetical protein SAMN04487936_11584 [Halobacillus dabanensis]|uniref:Uncharacterized protein n=1 Tax=Halobacillus dabanensis TaxID=240302 RepID=A0A1I4A097_HALDA|nr:hypothetical protein SAMN04487936_11584 [Halobacillus dabanensis]
MDNYKFEEFINIANELNNMDVIPPESSIQFGIIDTLSTFAGVHLEELEIHQQRGVKYY